MNTIEQRFAVAEGLPDCAALETLSLEAIRENLEIRFKRTPQEIYTWVGAVLLSVNPFRTNNLIYDDRTKKRFLEPLEDSQKFPHIFAIGYECYKKTLATEVPQTVVVTGESGAGKTESCRFLVNFLTFSSLHRPTPVSNGGLNNPHSPSTEATLISAGTVLEAFGSAKTANNNNSSRFGKFTEIKFDSFGRVQSAHLRTFLLAKSRVTKVIQGEQNFTVFHSLIRDWRSVETLQQFQLNSAYDYLNTAGEQQATIIPDNLKLEDIEECLGHLGLDVSQRKEIWRTLIGILELGNLKFRCRENETTEVDGIPQLKLICQLFGIEQISDLVDALTKQTIYDQHRFFSIDKAKENRDSVAKMIYGKLFEFLVETANTALGHSNSVLGLQPKKDGINQRQINILDIYGFEIEPINSFDQMCINYTNECLQGLFSQHLVVRERQLYLREGLPSVLMDIVDLDEELVGASRATTIAHFFDGQNGVLGIFQLLNDAANAPSRQNCNRDSLFLSSVTALQHTSGFKTTLPSVKIPPQCFAVNHSFSPVVYTATDFVTQDRGGMTADLQKLFAEKTTPFIATNLFKDEFDIVPNTQPISSTGAQIGTSKSGTPNASSKRLRRCTSLSILMSQTVRALIKQLDQSQLSFVRCIKPNDRRIPFYFDKKRVESQLRYAGIQAVVQVMKSGYPCRVDIKTLIRHIPGIEQSSSSDDESKNHRHSNGPHQLSDRQLIELMIGPTHNDCQVGFSKVFFKKGKQSLMDRLLDSPPSLEELALRWKQSSRRHIRGIIRGVVWIIVAFKNIRRWRAAVKLQSAWRGLLVERGSLERLNAIENLQTLIKQYRSNARLNQESVPAAEAIEREIREKGGKREIPGNVERTTEGNKEDVSKKEMGGKEVVDIVTPDSKELDDNKKEIARLEWKTRNRRAEHSGGIWVPKKMVAFSEVSSTTAEIRNGRRSCSVSKPYNGRPSLQERDSAAQLRGRSVSRQGHAMGQVTVGQVTVGQAPMGHAPMGHAPMGHAPMGHAPMGQAPMGQYSAKQRSSSRRRSQSRGPQNREAQLIPPQSYHPSSKASPSQPKSQRPPPGKPPLPSRRSRRDKPSPMAPTETSPLSNRKEAGQSRCGSRRRSRSRRPSDRQGVEQLQQSHQISKRGSQRAVSVPARPRPGDNTIILGQPEPKRSDQKVHQDISIGTTNSPVKRNKKGSGVPMKPRTSSLAPSSSKGGDKKRRKEDYRSMGSGVGDVCMPGAVRPKKLQLPPVALLHIRKFGDNQERITQHPPYLAFPDQVSLTPCSSNHETKVAETISAHSTTATTSREALQAGVSSDGVNEMRSFGTEKNQDVEQTKKGFMSSLQRYLFDAQ